jgi:hypothetical protein
MSEDSTSSGRLSGPRPQRLEAGPDAAVPRPRTVVWTRVDHADLVAAARHGAEAFGRGIRRDHNPFALTMFVARVRGARAVLLCIQAAAWWVGWDEAADRP